MRRTMVLAISLIFASPWPVVAKPKVDADIATLAKVIGRYPPDFSSEKQKNDTIATYERVKAAVDAAVKAHPESLPLLYQRADLESMGHNMDYPNAFNDAKRDFVDILERDPAYEPAILGLADMVVNASPDYAPKAEALFRAAQCLHRTEPLEEAQRGLFFAFYYQGHMAKAVHQAEFLVHQWPDVPVYHTMLEMAAARAPKETPNSAKLNGTMTACR